MGHYLKFLRFKDFQLNSCILAKKASLPTRKKFGAASQPVVWVQEKKKPATRLCFIVIRNKSNQVNARMLIGSLRIHFFFDQGHLLQALHLGLFRE